MFEPAHSRQLLDNLITAVIVLDQKLNLCHLNLAAEMLLGVSGEQALGKPISYCFTEAGGVPEILTEAIRFNNHFTKRRVTWRLHTLQEITVDYSVSPNADMQVLILEVQPLDRLLRISREEALLSSQETTRNLVRSLAHEIKNPLGGIRGAAQLLARELVSQDLEEYTRVIIDETDRLRNLVDRMLGPNKPSERKSINIHEVLEHIATVVKAEAEKKISILRDYDPSIPDLLADKEQLIQATLNVVRNAMQALLENPTERAPLITLSTRIQRRYTIGRRHYPLVIRVGITDNGPGIPANLIEDIFFPMITGRAEGTGLGLAIAQKLINQHHGLIECNSRPGCTEFAIYLPLDDNYAEA
jgi:two-component system, NtrC family, nitrogen regulation sensor histidine kinase GlnL